MCRIVIGGEPSSNARFEGTNPASPTDGIDYSHRSSIAEELGHVTQSPPTASSDVLPTPTN